MQSLEWMGWTDEMIITYHICIQYDHEGSTEEAGKKSIYDHECGIWFKV